MEIKLFEIRDAATTIPAMATRLSARSEAERWLLSKAGYGVDPGDQHYVLFMRLADCESYYDPYSWHGSRTMHLAHVHVLEQWDKLKSGDVVDVQFVLGETKEPKLSEQTDA